MPINIHGKEYITVAERITALHESLADKQKVTILTEIVQHEPAVLFKATITIDGKGTFTGYSAANPTKAIEKMSPYEVAETSAVGRALGFAGYGVVDSIASADEIAKPAYTTPSENTSTKSQNAPQSKITPKMVTDTTTDGELNLGTVSGKIPDNAKAYGKCPKCGAPNKLSASGTIYCSAKCWLNGR